MKMLRTYCRSENDRHHRCQQHLQHKVGNLPLDIGYQRYLPRCKLKLISSPDLMKFIISAREDYVREEGDEDCWQFNPKWKVLPSISWVDGKGPCVLTCNEHDHGTKLHFIHPCRWKHHLPARRTDQLCQAVVKPRIVRPVRVSKYCSTFQMFQQNGTFNGLDTCSNTTYGNFDSISKLSAEAEARSIANRPDINAHLTKLRKEKVISEYVEKSKREFAERFSSTIDYSVYSNGGTFVTLEASMIMQREMSDRTTKALVDDREGARPVNVSFSKLWSASLYPCQNMTTHRVIFPKVPNFKSTNTNTQLIWTISGLISRVESLWQVIDKVELKTSQWYGWLMVYLTKQCFDRGGRRQNGKDPFKYKFISTVEKITEKINEINSELNLASAFEEINSVRYYDLSEDQDNNNLQDVMNAEDDLSDIKVVIASFTTMDAPLILSINNQNFELQTIIGVRSITDTKWDGTIYSRHSGSQFQSWWKQDRYDIYPIQVNEMPDIFPNDHKYTVVYIRMFDVEISKIRNEFLKNLGGQSHVQCHEHRLPLISSTERSNKCHCGKKEFY